MRYTVSQGDLAFYIYDHARGRTVDLPGCESRAECEIQLKSFLRENAQADSDTASELAFA